MSPNTSHHKNRDPTRALLSGFLPVRPRAPTLIIGQPPHQVIDPSLVAVNREARRCSMSAVIETDGSRLGHCAAHTDGEPTHPSSRQILQIQADEITCHARTS